LSSDSTEFEGFATSIAANAAGGDYSLESLIEEEDRQHQGSRSENRAESMAENELYSDASDLFLTGALETTQQQSYSASAVTGSTGSETESYGMQTIAQVGCGCAACSGGQPAIHSDYGSISSASSDAASEAVNSGGGGGGAGSGKPTATVGQFTDYMINGFWQDFGGSARSWSQSNVTFSISNSYSAAQKTGIRMAFDQWDDIADITFTEVASGGNINIVVGNDGSAWSGSSTSGGNIISNTISIDTSLSFWSDISDVGDYALLTAIHEIGHSLGLGHTGNYNGSANFATDAVWANDTRQYSVMSYFDADNSGSDHSDTNGWQYGSTPALYDIYAIQQIYGANNTTRAGNTTYGFNSNAGKEQFDFTLTDDPVISIWDAGGIDTLDLSGYSTASTIRLTAGEFTSAGGMTNNISIAFGTTIENATGGGGADSIYGNTANNILLGGGGNDTFFGSTGNDTLNGQAGTDTASYLSYAVNAFAFNFIDSVTVAINHLVGGWTSTLINIENFIFSDGSYTFADLETSFGEQENDFAPTVNANNLTLNIDEVRLASTIITASDADGNALTYEVWDSTTANASGYFELAGSRLSAGSSHNLTQAQFNTLNIVGGDAGGTDQMWVRVSDGEHTTAWKQFNLTTNATGGGGANLSAPVVNANNLSLSADQVVLASTAINASDADGNALTYHVWDSTTATTSGFFQLAGAQLSAGVSHSLTQAQFNTLNIVGGDVTGTDQLWVRVTDGVNMTAWKSFTLSTTAAGGGGANLAAPVVNANNLTLNADQVALASTAITATDADGNTLTYQVWDSTTADSSGYFELAGARLSAGASHNLTQAQFNTLNIVGGDAAGTDQLWVRVSDGANMTAWKSFNLTTNAGAGGGGANLAAPTVNANNLSLGIDEVRLASTAITANDADGNTLSYEVWDSGVANNSGYFELAGARLSTGTGHQLTQAQFNALNIVGGDVAGTDQLWVRVSDGAHTTAWATFNLTTNSSGGGGNLAAPTVNANNVTIDFTLNTLASTVITANDADGNALSYEVWDSTAAGNSGYFDLAGVRLGTGVGHVLTQAQFSALRIYSGTVEGDDQLWVRVSDGVHTTAWKQFKLTSNDPNNMAGGGVLDMGHADDVALAQTSQSEGSSNGAQLSGGGVFNGVSGFQEENNTGII